MIIHRCLQKNLWKQLIKSSHRVMWKFLVLLLTSTSRLSSWFNFFNVTHRFVLLDHFLVLNTVFLCSSFIQAIYAVSFLTLMYVLVYDNSVVLQLLPKGSSKNPLFFQDEIGCFLPHILLKKGYRYHRRKKFRHQELHNIEVVFWRKYCVNQCFKNPTLV